MKILLVSGVSYNDIFMRNMAKWLVKTTNADVDIFAFQPKRNYVNAESFYRECECVKNDKWFSNIYYINNLLNPAYYQSQFKSFLKGKEYDIIHFHWLNTPIVMTEDIRKYGKKIFATFWGGEFSRLSYLYSKKKYRGKLELFISQVDGIVNSKSFIKQIESKLPMFRGHCYHGNLGSAPLEQLYKLMEKESKIESKKKLNIPEGKTTVQIGYSGKVIHQHLKIIESLVNVKGLCEKIHIISPMTRDFSEKYVLKIEQALKQSGFSYTLLKGFFSDEEIARLRNATDITMQYSISDGFSRSIIEGLCAKSILLYGTWLDYEEHFEEYGFKAIGTSTIEEGCLLINDLINEIESYADDVNSNFANGKHGFLWSECIDDWVIAYKEELADV